MKNFAQAGSEETVEGLLERLCDKLEIPVEYNLAELLLVLSHKGLVQREEIEKMSTTQIRRMNG
ncbi:hypothetical protein [Laceyella sacchari]|uniref:Uncharacterized protein n=1 Tax=Laceyella sacchari TaxID=37482 RepID=A0ABY5U8E2_LACSH|nr:hypothetical protein [Laceyella sacchari]KPC75511.1 hypothetical protein ADL26_07435 [Thermoactinomyces vulgaris]UWE04875.1 hypothetical protein NYR52_07075 [Laceyella sacchari]